MLSKNHLGEVEKEINPKNLEDEDPILAQDKSHSNKTFKEVNPSENPDEICFLEREKGEISFILKMYEESKKIKSLFFSSLVGRKKDFQKLKNILGCKLEGIGELLIGEISQGTNKRWIIGWIFNDYR